ncbi:MAG TPA: NAD(P)-dependent oxidoreductase [Gemmatimonadaceae bacterium]|nr:NAD(P)-dependent oxidoreductase [Gemmatimonadaceae bacterium]
MDDAGRPTVGFVGLGAMGVPMALNIRRAGFPLVVHTRTAARAAPVLEAGATWADDPAGVASRGDVVLTCLNTVDAVEGVYLAADGLVAAARPGAVLVDHSTVSPALAQRIGEAARARGVHFLDAPVSGGPEGAAKGTLAIMVGGSAEGVERALPVLGCYGATIRRMGEVGAGTRAKLVNQLLTFVHGAVAAEAIALAQASGLDLASLAEVLRAGFAQSRMLDRTLARVTAHDYTAGASLALYEKDLGLVQAEGAAHALDLPVAAAARAILREALQAGLARHDIAALRLRYPDASQPA